MRLMLGAEPDVAEDLSRLRRLDGDHLPEEDGTVRLAEALKEHHRLMEEDRDLIAFSRKADERIARMIEWLRSENVEVRLLKGRFLHGKAFIVETNHDGVLAGSSNFTYAGLARNVELNLGQYQPGVVGEVMDWYEENWDASEPFDLAGLYEKRFAEYEPYVVYLRMLWERYKDELDRDGAGDRPRPHRLPEGRPVPGRGLPPPQQRRPHRRRRRARQDLPRRGADPAGRPRPSPARPARSPRLPCATARGSSS